MSDLQNFEKALEDVLFNKIELNNLKSIIKAIVTDKKNDKLLREEIIKTRINMMRDLLRFFPFFIQSIKDTNKISIPNNTLQEELHEKDALLEQLGQKINNIYNNLKEKGQLKHKQNSINKSEHNIRLIEREYSQNLELLEKSNLDKFTLKSDIIFINNQGLKVDDVKFVIDGANIATENLVNGRKVRKVSNIYALFEKLNNLGIENYIIMCDRTLYYEIDNQIEYQRLIDVGKISEISGGSQADNYILQYAIENNAYMITNDLFQKEENQEFVEKIGKSWIKEHRIGFHFEDGTLFFDRIYKIKDKRK